ncbi:MAG: hypothetical protein E7Y34_01795, partial [Mycoplasma sp.]|nr:hypothetical protein [Mycoplasma sp.]
MNNMLKVNTTHLNSWIRETKIKNKQNFKSLKYLLNNSDKHSMLTIIVQEFIKNNKLKTKTQTAKLITVIKLISILSINPYHDTKLSKTIYTNKILINNNIQELLIEIDPKLNLKYIEYEKLILKTDE